MPGRLYIVATPIGHLGDITFRAVEVLKKVDLIACEDTRTSRPLLDHYQISTRCVAFHGHSTASATDKLLERIDTGKDVALISDRGTPLVSDPGGVLVQAAFERGFQVVPIPGPSAVTTAMMASPIASSGRFLFLGFLARSTGEKAAILKGVAHLPVTLVIFEAANRLRNLLELIRDALGERQILMARELTKQFEDIRSLPVSRLISELPEDTKGELTVLVGPSDLADWRAPATRPIDEDLKEAMERPASTQDIAETLRTRHGISKREAYRRVLAIRAVQKENDQVVPYATEPKPHDEDA
jgi:16S rRNA (cytidine1402-2'-O)-methyltransferase